MGARFDFAARLLLSALLALAAGCAAEGPAGRPAPEKGRKEKEVDVGPLAPRAHVKAQYEKLAPVELRVDLDRLPADEREVLRLLVRAAGIMDRIFLEQVDRGNPALEERLARMEDPLYLDYFRIMFGPWDRLDEDRPFIGDRPKPPGAGYYPPGLTREAFRAWLDAHPEDRGAFESNFTVIRKKGDGLEAVPYSKAYAEPLGEAAALLRKAAEVTRDPSLAKFLRSRAEAFLSDDYYRSDMDWMDLSGDIEVVIGPYEVYEDALFGYKAAFEAFVCVVDHGESAKLARIADYLDAMEKNLPNPEEHKNFDRGHASPIKVVNELFTAGDAKAGIQTSAFNLPNDERVREAKGSKKVLLKNVMSAKYEKCWIPIVRAVLAPETLKRVSFDAYFNHVLLHEVSHGLGPGRIVKDGKATTVNRELKDRYSTIEECKADVLGIYNMQFLVDQGVLPRSLQESMYASYLGGMFRSIRFGINEAHGGGVAIQLNYCLDRGGFRVGEDGRFSVDESVIRDAVRELAHDLLLIEAKGDYDAAGKFIERYRYLRPEVEKALERVKDVPVDIRPVYPVEKEL